ncbi:DUF1684 domain-containing protein [Nocardioides stalactiti]|uniref:DUF1684 domain-containing protein n=1 Tax=Nocardioides stalactiti TaxID=2755356 RepID=UPI0028AD6491|nr:DUF1684 domain-containing protein [Nocardioides stalactiti]
MDDATFLGEWQEWHDGREARLVAPHGFLAITGLHWLDPSPQRIDGIPGAWSTGPEGVVVELGGDERLTLDGRELGGRAVIGPVDDRGVQVEAGDVRIEVATRAGAVLVRPRDPSHWLRSQHVGTPTYPVSRSWAVPARFHRYAQNQPTGIEIQNLASGVVEDAVGEVEFEIDGRSQRLVALDDDGGLWLLFADATSGRTTYGAGRQLYAPAPRADGSLVIDFNRATNLPCAYTDFTTCPVPMARNRLLVAIEAGERNPE